MDGTVKIMENPNFLMDDLGVYTPIFGNTRIEILYIWIPTQPSWTLRQELFHYSSS